MRERSSSHWPTNLLLTTCNASFSMLRNARCFISAAETFCASYYSTCDGNGGRFGSTAECIAVFNSLAAGDAGATSGASQACLECKGNHERMIGMPDRQTATHDGLFLWCPGLAPGPRLPRLNGVYLQDVPALTEVARVFCDLQPPNPMSTPITLSRCL